MHNGQGRSTAAETSDVHISQDLPRVLADLLD
jgi:hypothetical protein